MEKQDNMFNDVKHNSLWSSNNKIPQSRNTGFFDIAGIWQGLFVFFFENIPVFRLIFLLIFF